MKFLTELAGDLDVSTAQVITALRIAATRADVGKLIEWTEKELEGYQRDDELPSHRIWKLSIKATLHNSSQGYIQNVHVGDLSIDEELREKVTTFYCLEGIWQIEDMLYNSEGQIFGAEHPNLAQIINLSQNNIADGWICTHATAEYTPMRLHQVVNYARQTALKFCLECEKKGIELRWENDDDIASEDRTEWIEMIKEEGTKTILKSICDTVLKGLML